MRAALVLLLVLTIGPACDSQKLKFSTVDKTIVVQRARQAPGTDPERAVALREMFVAAGCEGTLLVEQRIAARGLPNVVCHLQGTGPDTIIIGAHFDRAASPQRPLDDWTGSSLLPSLYQCLSGKKRLH